MTSRTGVNLGADSLHIGALQEGMICTRTGSRSSAGFDKDFRHGHVYQRPLTTMNLVNRARTILKLLARKGLARLGNACTRLALGPSIRSRRAVSNGRPLLSVAYDLSCLITFFVFLYFWSKKFASGHVWKCLYETVDGSINQISSSCAQRWCSFVCSFNVALLRGVFFWLLVGGLGG